MGKRTDTEDLYDRLRSEGVFEESGKDIRLTDEFVDTRERWQEEVAEFDESTYAARVEEYATEGEVPADDVDERTLADAIAVRETCETIDSPTSAHVARSLQRSETGDENPNVPAGFVALSGEEMEQFMQAHPASVFFCWRKDCRPCELVREDLEALRSDGEIPENVGLGAIYGPDNAEVLYEKYEVGGSPTMLFCSEDGVESRYVGYPGIEGLKSEILTIAAET